MSDYYFVLADLRPTSALRLIMEFVAAGKARRIEFLREIRLQLAIPELSMIDPSVALAIPDPYQDERQQSETFEAFVELYRRITGNDVPARTGDPGASFGPLIDVLPDVLIASGMEAAQLQIPAHKKRKLLVARNITVERAAEILKELQFYATHLTGAIADTPHGKYYLFDIVDDERRGSGFQGTIAGGFFPELEMLDYYQNTLRPPEYAVCLPRRDRAQLSRQALLYFCQILSLAPRLFGGETPHSDTDIVAVVYAPDADQPSRMLYTGNLPFHREMRLASRVSELAQYEILSLQESDSGLAELRQKIEALEPKTGYRLELRRSAFLEWDAAEYDRLSLLRQEIAERLAELENLRKDRPKLYRFTQKQLPLLADKIRSFSMGQLKELLYGFQGTSHQYSEGLHFLYVEPHVVMTELDPLIYWEDFTEQPVEFWLDPTWGRFYYGRENKATVFVPKRMRLFPSLHSETERAMGNYLREMMSSHLSRSNGRAEIPENPIYIFEPEVASGERLTLTILNKENFVPVDSPEVIGWVNDALLVLEHLGTETLIREMASEITRERIAQRVAETAAESQARYDDLRARTRELLADKTRDLTEEASCYLNEIIKLTRKSAEEARELNERLAQIKALHRSMRELADETLRLADETERKAGADLSEHTRNQVKRVHATIHDADRTRRELTDHVNETVDQLKQTRASLERKLDELRGLLQTEVEE